MSGPDRPAPRDGPGWTGASVHAGISTSPGDDDGTPDRGGSLRRLRQLPASVQISRKRVKSGHRNVKNPRSEPSEPAPLHPHRAFQTCTMLQKKKNGGGGEINDNSAGPWKEESGPRRPPVPPLSPPVSPPNLPGIMRASWRLMGGCCSGSGSEHPLPPDV